MHDIIIEITTGLVKLGILALIPYVFNFLKAHTTNQKYQFYLQQAQTIVTSIEQVMASSSGSAKKAVVSSLLSSKLKGALSAAEIDHLIESAVYAMNTSIGQQTNNAIPTKPIIPVTYTPSPVITQPGYINPVTLTTTVTTSGEAAQSVNAAIAPGVTSNGI